MNTGVVEANLIALLSLSPAGEVEELVERKRAGAEHMALDARELEHHLAQLGRLEERLEKAQEASNLPNEPTTQAELDDWVVKLRLDQGVPA